MRFQDKGVTEETKQLAWDEHLFQLEAYRHGIGMPEARMINVFISTNNPGLVRVVEHKPDTDWYWQVFQKALDFWYVWRKY